MKTLIVLTFALLATTSFAKIIDCLGDLEDGYEVNICRHAKIQ